ncbi:ankyrin repeat-containing domain protein [Trametes meyenii]|nr:ankyrin repeat-containing domain protein [Trametes meyenii]
MQRQPGSGGFVVTPEMQRLLDQPGPLPVERGGQRLRTLYQKNSAHFDPDLLDPFARACFMGNLAIVRGAVESGRAPDLSGQVTPYKHGYVAQALFGAQRLVLKPGAPYDHVATLKYLLDHGAPLEVPDILGYTALDHACMALPRADIARILLEHGADPNHQDRFGSVALIGAFQNDSIDAIEVLMEYGARLDIQDADGETVEAQAYRCGPRVTAVVKKWKRKRAGMENPTDVKACVVCGARDVMLKWCSRCHTIWYCSKECQRHDWQTHKLECIPYNASTTVTLKPVYGGFSSLPTADITRLLLGHPVGKQNARNTSAKRKPHIRPGETKNMVIKVQVPFDLARGLASATSSAPLTVYDRKRTFECQIRKEDNPEGYLRLAQAVHAHGVMGAKAYFSAEMQSPDELVVKVSEVLPEKAF